MSRCSDSGGLGDEVDEASDAFVFWVRADVDEGAVGQRGAEDAVGGTGHNSVQTVDAQVQNRRDGGHQQDHTHQSGEDGFAWLAHQQYIVEPVVDAHEHHHHDVFGGFGIFGVLTLGVVLQLRGQLLDNEHSRAGRGDAKVQEKVELVLRCVATVEEVDVHEHRVPHERHAGPVRQ